MKFLAIIPITVGLIVLLAFNNKLKKMYYELIMDLSLTGSPHDPTGESIISRLLSIEYPKSLYILPEYKNITSALILRFIEFVLAALITLIFNNSIPVTIYGIFFSSIEIFKYSTRVSQLKDISENFNNQITLKKSIKKAFLIF